MADFIPALSKTLSHEGGFFHDKETGEVANYGITHWTLRSLGLVKGVATTTPRTVPASEAEIELIKDIQPGLVQAIYKTQYWDAVKGSDIPDQTLAEKVFDLQVNTGRGAHFLQRAINTELWPSGIVEDGRIGQITLAALRNMDPVKLLATVKAEASKYYHTVADNNKMLAKNLNPWLNRLES